MMPVPVEIRRSSDRFESREPGRLTRHSFSFGAHYDPENTGFGPMVCHDDHRLGRGAGFPDHPHADVVIVTWVLEGAVLHHDRASSEAVRLTPGTVAVQSAGTGVVHAETAAADAGPTRFVQVWLTPDEPGGDPSYDVREVILLDGELVEVAAPAGVAGGRFAVARLPGGASLTLPAAERQHVFVARGALTRSSLAQPLGTGDAFRVTDEPGLAVTAAVPTELLVWSFRAPAPRG